jgi:hypothetical protein
MTNLNLFVSSDSGRNGKCSNRRLQYRQDPVGGLTPRFRLQGTNSISHPFLSRRPPCKLSRASGPRNPMKIASIQVIIENGWDWRDRNDSGAAKAECKFDPERA